MDPIPIVLKVGARPMRPPRFRHLWLWIGYGVY